MIDSVLTQDSVVAQGDVAWVAIDREAVVHHPAGSTAYVLDPMAAVLWQCLDGESTLAEVLADIAEVVGAPLADVTAGCLPVVTSWVEAGIAIDRARPGAHRPTRTPYLAAPRRSAERLKRSSAVRVAAFLRDRDR